eukprot:COSAG01_NODE_29894_length_627_cov_1.172348_1_plen_54_part_01
MATSRLHSMVVATPDWCRDEPLVQLDLVTIVCLVWCPPTNRGHMAAHSTLRRSQ